MSRLDDALQRTGARTTGSSDQGVFVSAWSEDHQEPQVDRSTGVKTSARIAQFPPTSTAPASISLTSSWRDRLATPDGDPVMLEQFRRLAATLHHAQGTTGLKTIMVTSATPDDGKTLTAVNLALVLSGSYHRRVLLIDADLRRPSLGHVADLSNAVGLGEALRAPTEQKLAVLQVSPNLVVLPAGRPDPDPLGALTSDRMQQILQEASAHFDWVVLDAPPMGPMADGSVLSRMVDGAIFIIRAGHSQYPAVRKAVEMVGRERILGVVLNGVTDLKAEHYGYGYSPEAR